MKLDDFDLKIGSNEDNLLTSIAMGFLKLVLNTFKIRCSLDLLFL